MSSVRWIAALTIACACAACEREPTQAQEKRSGLDPRSLVTQDDATAIFGRPAIRIQSGEGECAWGYDAPDHSSWSLHLKVSDMASLYGPVIIVTKSEITYKGQPIDTGPTISQAHKKLLSAGTSASSTPITSTGSIFTGRTETSTPSS